MLLLFINIKHPREETFLQIIAPQNYIMNMTLLRFVQNVHQRLLLSISEIREYLLFKLSEIPILSWLS
jgi:hypothetical protein